jgi:hypothetical protein
MSERDFVDLSISYTKYKAGCVGKWIFSNDMTSLELYVSYNFFLDQGSDPIMFATFVQNHTDFLSLQTVKLDCSSPNYMVAATTSTNTSNLQKFQASPNASSLAFNNSLPSQISSRIGLCDKSLRNARMASTRPRSKINTCLFFISLKLITLFLVSVPALSSTVHFFLLGGPNWYKAKANHQEKSAIDKLYEAARVIELPCNLNTEETASAIRKYNLRVYFYLIISIMIC